MPEDEPKQEPAIIIPKAPPRQEVINALMFRVTADGRTQFVWPHSELIAEYKRRGFVLLIDAATIDREEARSAEIQAVREQEEDMWRRRSFEKWAKAWKRDDEK